MSSADMTRAVSALTAYAVVEHGEAGDRLILVERHGGHVTGLSEVGQTPRDITFSDDGKRIAWRTAGRLRVYPSEQDWGASVGGIEASARKAFCFAADGRALWAAGATGLALIDLVARPAKVQHVSVGDGCRITELRKAFRDDAVWVLCSPAPAKREPQVLQFDASGRRLGAEAAPGASRLLGFRPDGALLYVRTSGAGDEIVALVRGVPEVVRPAVENEFVLDYLPATQQLVMARGAEDSGDATVLHIGPLGGVTRPWLARFPRLADLAVGQDEQWALFVDRSPGDNPRQSGAIRIAVVGSDETQLLLDVGASSYSHPVPRPVGHASVR